MSESSPGPGLPSRFAATLEKCERQAAGTINSKLESLFDNAGQVFIEFAEKAQNDQVQAGFFSARGSLLANRGHVQRKFNLCFSRAFAELGQPISQTFASTGELSAERAEWSLVDKCEMDEMVATQNLIAKARDRHFSELYALRQRLSLVNRGQPLDERGIPTGPFHLVHCFRRAIAGLDLESRARTVLYVLFDRYVLRDVKELYQEFNEALIADGILPNLKHVLNPSRTKTEALGKTASYSLERGNDKRPDGTLEQAPRDLPQADLPDKLFGSILNLMASRNKGGAIASNPERGFDGTAGVSGGIAVGRSALLVSISRVQALSESAHGEAFVDLDAAASLEVDPSFVDGAKKDLSAERQQIFKQAKPEQMARVDLDTIDVVGLLFEYMLNDAALPNLAKALISRAHTPYLKAALSDRSLLDDAGHPARQLLDLMVEAGGYYVDGGDPKWGIFPALRIIVDRILSSFSYDPLLFQGLLDNLQVQVDVLKRKVVTLEQRSRQAAEGRERFQVAKRKVAEAIDQRTQEPLVLPEVEAFLRKVWSDKLVYVLLRDPDGEEGDEWQHALRVADDLVALCDRKTWALPRADFEASLLGLHDEIELALDSLGIRKPADWLPLAALLSTPRDLVNRLSESKPRPNVSNTGALERESQQPIIGQSLPGSENQKYVDQLRALEFDTWFEFAAKDGAPHRRLKLSWHSPITETCMFVDRGGVKADAFTMSELAAELAAGRATILAEPQQHFVERALHAILQMLRAPHAPKQA